MSANIHETTGIAYGYVSSNDMNSDVVQSLMFNHGKNLSEDEALEEEGNRQRAEFEGDPSRFEPDFSDFESQIEEPIIEGCYQGVKYRTSWMGGALCFFIFESPLITNNAKRASPCVPNAGILPPEECGSVTCYDIPYEWYAEDTPIVLDDFTKHYLIAAMWSTNDESTPEGGEPIDDNYGLDDFAPEALKKALSDCQDFQISNAADLAEAYELYQPHADAPEPQCAGGHDFWLTREGHGVGFWDRGFGELGDRLTAAAKVYKGCDLYVGDDNKLHFMGE